jgi:predicted metal-binding membrane protein
MQLGISIGHGGVAAAGAPSPGQLLLRWRLAIVGALVGLAALAWWSTGVRMAGMDAGPGTDPGALGFFITTWVVMMAAMMFPSIAPMTLMYARIENGRRARAAAAGRGAIGFFVAGYLLLWGAAGLLGYAAIELARRLDGGFFAWHHAGRWTAAAVLLAAAIYELTPAKDACLGRCRSPLGFLVTSWRDGRIGALRMGAVHGAWCLGCCWLLMGGLFALGAMSVPWMIVIAVLIAFEKLLPWRTLATVVVALTLLLLALGVAAVPAHVPGLTVPSGDHGMQQMPGMDAGRMP